MSDLDFSDFPSDQFAFAQLRLILSVPHDRSKQQASLVAIETTLINFVAKDVYLEMRNCVDAHTQQLKAMGFNVSVARMRKKLCLREKITLSIDDSIFDTDSTKARRAEFVKLFDRRGHKRSYLATAYAVTKMTSHISSVASDSSGYGDDYSPSESQINEISLCFLADKRVSPGSRLRS